jgi:hypothetical protein
VNLGSPDYNVITLYKKENFKQIIWHSGFDSKICIDAPFPANPVVSLKNLSGFLELIGSIVQLCRFQKQQNGLYVRTFSHPYAFIYNVKKIKSNDLEHYAEGAQFIFF